MYKVSEAAALSGVTVRTLHHYDAIGLLQPSARSDAEYRLYDNDDIATLQRIRRYQSFGFSLEEIRELLSASSDERLAAFRAQRNAIRQRAAATAEMVSALNREITSEHDDESHTPSRLERASALTAEYLRSTSSESVQQQTHLLTEALHLLRPLTSSPPMDPAAVKLAVWIYANTYDWANVAALCERFLAQELDWEDRAYATLELVGALTVLAHHDEAVVLHKSHVETVLAERPGDEWSDAMWNSTHGAAWIESGNRHAWVKLFRTVDAGTVATEQNRANRFETLHTAVMLMGTEHEAYTEDIKALTERMAEIIQEDPDWSERLWAELRFEQQKVGIAVRLGNSDALTSAVDSYLSFLDSCDWPVKTIAMAYSNLGAILHWEGREETAVECFARAQQDDDLDGYGYAWFASASLANGAARELVVELLSEAGRRMEAADAMRIFNEDSVLSADSNKEELLNALLPTT